MAFPKRGEIWLVSLDPIVGHEIGKTRPALVISNDRNNEFAETVTVIPITSQTEKVYPFETSLPQKECNLPKDSKAKANQIRTVDKKRLVKLVGRITGGKMREVEGAINIHLGTGGGAIDTMNAMDTFGLNKLKKPEKPAVDIIS